MGHFIEDILNEAREVLLSRSGTYGTAEDSFGFIADLWHGYLSNAVQGRKLEPYDVANMMMLLKIAREKTQYKHDNYVDMIGYAVHADRLRRHASAASKLANAYSEGQRSEVTNAKLTTNKETG